MLLVRSLARSRFHCGGEKKRRGDLAPWMEERTDGRTAGRSGQYVTVRASASSVSPSSATRLVGRSVDRTVWSPLPSDQLGMGVGDDSGSCEKRSGLHDSRSQGTGLAIEWKGECEWKGENRTVLLASELDGCREVTHLHRTVHSGELSILHSSILHICICL